MGLWSFFFSSRRRHTRCSRDWSSDVCSSDLFAIGTYFTVSSVFLIMGLIPDIAAVRDVATGWRKKLYAITATAWRGTNEQRRHHTRGYLYLATLATPLRLSAAYVEFSGFADAF